MMDTQISRRRLAKLTVGALATPTILTPRAWADGKSIQVGIYTAQQGEYVRKQIIPQFEADYNCRVFTTEGRDADPDRRVASHAGQTRNTAPCSWTTSASIWPRKRA